MGERHEYRFYAGALPSQHDDVMSSYLILWLDVNSKWWLNQETIADLQSGRRIDGITMGSTATDAPMPKWQNRQTNMMSLPEGRKPQNQGSLGFQADIALAGARVWAIICQDARKSRYHPRVSRQICGFPPTNLSH